MDGRVVVLISGAGSNMLALADACAAGRVPGRVVAAVADRKCPGLEAAQERGIEAVLVEFSAFPSREEWSEALRDEVLAHGPDLVVLAGFMRITSPVFVDSLRGRLINLHPSLLPAFPGAHGVRDALEFGVKVTGSTVHLVDYEVDHGPVIMQEAVAVLDGDDEASLHERIKAVEHRMLPEACAAMLEGRVRLEGHRCSVDPRI